MKEIITFGYGDTVITEEVNFQEWGDLNDRKVLPKDSGVYLLYGAGDKVLYIGETKNLWNRLWDHVKGVSSCKKFYKDIVAIKYAPIDFGRSTRAVVEGILIEKYQPIHNCTDLDLAKSHGMTEELVHDLIFYAREHRLKMEYVAEKLGVHLATVRNYSVGALGSTIKLPTDYKPGVLLDLSKQKRTQKETVAVTEEMFHEVTALLKEGRTLKAIGEMYGISTATVSLIRSLKYKKYQQWACGK